MPPREVTCPSCRATNEIPEDPEGLLVCLACGRPVELSDALANEVEAADLTGEGTVGDLRTDAPGAVDSASPAADRAETGPAGEEEAELDDDTVGDHDTVDEDRSSDPRWDDEVAESWKEGALIADRFRITRIIGQGGMGKVYLAQDEILVRPIALKRVPQEILFDADARDDLRQEANRLLDLAHESIVRVHTFYDGPTWPFFAMEYLRGPTLKKLLRLRKQEGRTFSSEEVLRIARQVGAGLAHAHANNVVHRDLKPANLMLSEPAPSEITEECRLKITDFGISRVVADSTLRQTGKRSGTLPYMSPEQYLGEPSTVRSDVYSFACTLYELLSGRPPFRSGDIGYQILSVSPKPLDGVPAPMARSILRALSKDPQDRFESVEQFVDALEGKVRIPRRGFTRRLLALGSYMILGILFVLLLLTLGPQLLGRRGGNGEPSPGSGPEDRAGPGAVVTDRGRSEDVVGFVARLQTVLGRALPRHVGRPADAERLGNPPRTTYTVRIASAVGLPRMLLEGLVLRYYRADREADARYATVQLDGEDRLFLLEDLEQGVYYAEAYLRVEHGGEGEVTHQELGVSQEFIVDLVPPSFSLGVIDPDQLVDAAGTPQSPGPELRFATFDDELVLALTSTVAVPDIAEAYYRIVRDGVPADPIRIPDPSLWRVRLDTPGQETAFVVYAVDRAGNSSDSVKFRVKRHSLEVRRLEIASTSGNRTVIRGVLYFEGAQPELLFEVNDRLVETTLSTRTDVEGRGGAESSPVAGPPGEGREEGAGSTGAAAPELPHGAEPEEVVGSEAPGAAGAGRLPFEARLVLDQAVNRIEVLYSWRGGKERSFPKPARLPAVKVETPRLQIDPLPEATSASEITVSGRVEPYFEGLVLEIHSDVGFDRVQLDSVGGDATFTQRLRLIPDQRNHVAFTATYKDQPLLEPALPAVTILSDRILPTCREVILRGESEQEMLLQVIFSEPLARLRGRIVGGAVSGGEMVDLPLEPLPPSQEPAMYKLVFRQPYRPLCRLQLEMTDHAGNSKTAEESIYRPPGELGVASSEGDGSGHPRPAVHGSGESARVVPAMHRESGTVVLRSRFVVDMGMEFVPFGTRRVEISRTEVPEIAWVTYLREEKQKDLGSGHRDEPMVVGEEPVDLARDFVRWFEKEADDGYEYFIPSVEHWLCAFAGSGNRRQAEEAIRAWFHGDGEPGEPAFDPTPPASARYGVNRPSRIGSRSENVTPSGLLDMESNVQEIVTESESGSVLWVIGGHNQLTDPEAMLDHCLRPRLYDEDRQAMQRKLTGLRLCRRPARAVEKRGAEPSER